MAVALVLGVYFFAFALLVATGQLACLLLAAAPLVVVIVAAIIAASRDVGEHASEDVAENFGGLAGQGDTYGE